MIARSKMSSDTDTVGVAIPLQNSERFPELGRKLGTCVRSMQFVIQMLDNHKTAFESPLSIDLIAKGLDLSLVIQHSENVSKNVSISGKNASKNVDVSCV